MQKKKEKSVIKGLQKRAGELWKKYALVRDGECRLCGSRDNLQVHHIFSRTKKRLFLDVENSLTLCRSCHCSVTWDDSYKEKVRRLIEPITYERLFEQACLKGTFLEWKSIDWLEGQIKILEELT